MKQKMFRLTDDQIKKLKSVAEKRGCTETEVIRSCIEQLDEDTQCIAPDRSEIVAELQKQVEEKREELRQMRGLLERTAEEAREERARHAEAMERERKASEDKENRLLSALVVVFQEQARAAQALPAAEKKETTALESTEQKKTRWQRLKEAWKG